MAEARETGASPVRTIILAVIGLLIIAGAVWFFWKRNKQPEPAVSDTADQIRQAFVPPLGEQSSTTPVANGNPPQAATTTNPAAVAPSPAPVRTPQQPMLYSNSNFGFQLQLPTTWQVNQDQQPNMVSFSGPGGKNGYVEMYDLPSQETLQSVTNMLKKSPSVISVAETTVDGQPAVRFRGRSASQSGIAVLARGKLYYLRQQVAVSPLLTNFRFLQ